MNRRDPDAILALAQNVTDSRPEQLTLPSADDHPQHQRRDRQVLRVGDLPSDLVAAIAATEPPAEAAAFDTEYAAKPVI
jgi:hypothetical protein